jgi:hypothetical protein
MTTRRFEVTRVPERQQEPVISDPSEIIPLIHVETDIPLPPPLPLSFTSINETNRAPPRLFNSFLQRFKPRSASTDVISRVGTIAGSIPQSISVTNLTVGSDSGKVDSYYSTTHSNVFDTNSLRLTNKFLHELRLKRRELYEKADNLPIDQRMRAQDIFAVHFAMNESETMPSDIYNEDAQEKIRKNIFNELDRQRMKQYNKQHRHLIWGRALLMLITSLLLFMSITLIYVVIDLYDRAKYAEATLPDSEFVSIINDMANDAR